MALKQFFSKFLCFSLLITILPLLLLLSLGPEMCIDLTRHVTTFRIFKLQTLSHLLVSQEDGACADYGKYYSQIFSLVPSDFEKLILATLLKGNICVLYSVSQEECAILRESVPYVKLYRYNPKHLYPKLNGYGDNGQISLKL